MSPIETVFPHKNQRGIFNLSPSQGSYRNYLKESLITKETAPLNNTQTGRTLKWDISEFEKERCVYGVHGVRKLLQIQE